MLMKTFLCLVLATFVVCTPAPTPRPRTIWNGGRGCQKWTVPKHSLGECQQCLDNVQCAKGWFCCPYMMKCLKGGMGCDNQQGGWGNCSPRCRGNPYECTGCDPVGWDFGYPEGKVEGHFPHNWLGKYDAAGKWAGPLDWEAANAAILGGPEVAESSSPVIYAGVTLPLIALAAITIVSLNKYKGMKIGASLEPKAKLAIATIITLVWTFGLVSCFSHLYSTGERVGIFIGAMVLELLVAFAVFYFVIKGNAGSKLLSFRSSKSPDSEKSSAPPPLPAFTKTPVSAAPKPHAVV